MPLLKITNLCLHYGEQIIFDDESLQLDRGDRLCIIGRNGVGKSTLLKVMLGSETADSGGIWRDPTAVVASLSQELPEIADISVFDFVAAGVSEIVSALAEYDRAVAANDIKSLEQLQHVIEAADGWNLNNRIQQVLTRLDLDAQTPMLSLSGGWRRRAALAQALVANPDVLLLDEPTNHLDIVAIQWLEGQLNDFAGAIVFITHDRAFLKAVANRIAELDRGKFRLWQGNYQGFLDFREQELETEAKHAALFDKRLAREEIWIRQGIKARRTRNEGRVRALKKMRVERAARRDKPKLAKIEHGGEISSGKLVAELADVGFAYQNDKIVDRFSTTILRGDKVGLLGPNGIGKSTLLKLILGELQPQSGKVRLGTKLSIAYFDQMRDQLDLEKNAIDNIGEGRDSVEINGKPRHIISYLQDFLFSGERARTVIKSLSGGERNRILLAKLFSKPSNLLVMDEPTNDLDAETLELLEDLLASFEGTLLLVSHDRDFLDNVVSSTIAFEGKGKLKEFIGGYQDWKRQGGVWPSQKKNVKEGEVIPPIKVRERKKLGYKLQRELDSLPALLEKTEREIAALHGIIAAADFYQKPQEYVEKQLKNLEDNEEKQNQLFARWEELEQMQDSL